MANRPVAMMTYPAMAQDLLDTLDELDISRAIFIGHSMGGKAAMAVTQLAPERADRLIAIDIAPVDARCRHETTSLQPFTQSVRPAR